MNLDFLKKKMNLPKWETKESIYEYLSRFTLRGSPKEEMKNYLDEDFERFLHTVSLVGFDNKKRIQILEIGSNPYFTSLLIKKHINCELYCSNFFGDAYPRNSIQYMDSDIYGSVKFEFTNFNIEKEKIPYDTKFSYVLLCEVIEHLVEDPIGALITIKESLEENGYLILTTPNVSRLENVARMISGTNIYDPYSGYGIYGRHNREYNKHELNLLLNHLGFDIEVMYTSDVHENRSKNYFILEKFFPLVEYRKEDLGQYIFVKAKNEDISNLVEI